MKPLRRGDQYFTGGDIDLYPLEPARHLASEIVMTFNSGMVNFELLAIDVTLGYNMNDRLRTITWRIVTAEMEFMRRALVTYDRGFDRAIEALAEVTPPHAAQ